MNIILSAYILWSELGETSLELGPAFSMQFIVIEYLPIFFPVTWVSLLKTKLSLYQQIVRLSIFTSSMHSRSRFPCFASSQKKIRPALDKKLLAVSFVSIVSLAIWPSMAQMNAQTAKILIFDLEFSRLYFYEPAKIYLRDKIRKYLTNN